MVFAARSAHENSHEHMALPVVNLPLVSWPLSGVSEDCASTLEKHESLKTGNRKRVALIASQH